MVSMFRRLVKRVLPRSWVRKLSMASQQRRAVSGLPTGLSFERLDDLCRQQMASPLSQVSYIHLSGWKATGAFRLFLRAKNGNLWSLVYKNADYSSDQIPALEGLPARPGPPEFLLYQVRNNTALNEFLPTVHAAHEEVPGRHYQYLLEDLHLDYYRLSYSKHLREDLLRAVRSLPALQRAMKESLDSEKSTALITFDRAFGKELARYVHESLTRYLAEVSDGVVREVLGRWPQVTRLYQSDQFYENRPQCLIHGDYNSTNIHVHAADHHRMKLVDWEWAGVGVMHADLASIMWGCDQQLQDEALGVFAEENPFLPLDEHRRWYRFCRLERGLLNAGFVAKQHIESSHRVQWSPRFVQDAAEKILSLCRGHGN